MEERVLGVVQLRKQAQLLVVGFCVGPAAATAAGPTQNVVGPARTSGHGSAREWVSMGPAVLELALCLLVRLF